MRELLDKFFTKHESKDFIVLGKEPLPLALFPNDTLSILNTADISSEVFECRIVKLGNSAFTIKTTIPAHAADFSTDKEFLFSVDKDDRTAKFFSALSDIKQNGKNVTFEVKYPDDIQWFVSKKRSSDRVKFKISVRLIKDGAKTGVFDSARMVDISPYGIGLLVQEEYPEGTAFKIQFDSFSFPFEIKGRVIRVELNMEQTEYPEYIYNIGTEFVTPDLADRIKIYDFFKDLKDKIRRTKAVEFATDKDFMRINKTIADKV